MATGLRLPASMSLSCLDRGAVLAVIGAVPAVTIMKDLVLAGFSFELDEEDRLDLRSLTGGRPCVDRFNGYSLREKIELAH